MNMEAKEAEGGMLTVRMNDRERKREAIKEMNRKRNKRETRERAKR